jgi:hypothetical protein
MSFKQIGIKAAFDKGYRVDRQGIVFYKGRERKLQINRSGYYYFGIKVTGFKRKIFNVPVHRLQGYQKFGEVSFQEGMEIRHKNNVSTDNSESNILIGTHCENMMDMPAELRVARAINASKSITKYNHAAIKAFYEQCRSYKKTVFEFKLSGKSILHYILKNSLVALSKSETT